MWAFCHHISNNRWSRDLGSELALDMSQIYGRRIRWLSMMSNIAVGKAGRSLCRVLDARWFRRWPDCPLATDCDMCEENALQH
jgi:hypothetical protein